jgi:hypothetical protein
LIHRSTEGRLGLVTVNGEDDVLEAASGVEMPLDLLDLAIRAASSSGKPPTPVPNATRARLLAPSSSALARVLAVALRMVSADVGPPSSIVAAWITQLHGISPAVVSTALPSPIGARSSLSA